MIKDYIHPEYKIVEYAMSNGRKRYNAFVINSKSENTLVTLTGGTRPPCEYQSFLYLRHKVDEAVSRHKRLQFQYWLRDVSQIGVKSVSHADPRGAS